VADQLWLMTHIREEVRFLILITNLVAVHLNI